MCLAYARLSYIEYHIFTCYSLLAGIQKKCYQKVAVDLSNKGS